MTSCLRFYQFFFLQKYKELFVYVHSCTFSLEPHTHTHTLSPSFSLSLSVPVCLCLSFFLSLYFSFFHSFSLSMSQPVSYPLSFKPLLHSNTFLGLPSTVWSSRALKVNPKPKIFVFIRYSVLQELYCKVSDHNLGLHPQPTHSFGISSGVYCLWKTLLSLYQVKDTDLQFIFEKKKELTY